MSGHLKQGSVRAVELLQKLLHKTSHLMSFSPHWIIEQKQKKTLVWITQPTTMALHSWGALFIQWQLHSTPGNTEDIPIANNVAEEHSSKLHSQIGSVASTQLELKYDNCVSHYRTMEIALLKVRRRSVLLRWSVARTCAYTAEKSIMMKGQH